MSRRVYLDHAATTPVRAEVLAAMLPYFDAEAGHASSLHLPGQRAKKALEESRNAVARVLGADPSEVYFTSGGTESDNQAISGVAHSRPNKGRHLITSAIEHHAVLNTCQYLRGQGFEVTVLAVDRHGLVDLDQLRASLRDDTVLVSIMLANNEVGTIEPVAEVVRIAHERGALVHSDAVQAMARMPVQVNELGVDLLSLTAHKICGPKGVGALYVRHGTPIVPLLYGGHQESMLRPGTQNIPGIVGLGTALCLAHDELNSEPLRIAALRDRLQTGILARIPDVQVNGHPTARLGNILNVSVGQVDGETLLMALDTKGVAVSTGSACGAGAAELSHVLQAMDLDPGYMRGSLRFSLGHNTTQEDIDCALEALVDVVERLRPLAPSRAPDPV
jgi:cysteine desulfurase